MQEFIYKVFGILASVSYLGVDISLFRPLPNSKKNFILSVGGVEPNKRFDEIIEALSLISKARRPDFIIAHTRTEQKTLDLITRLAHKRDVTLKIVSNLSDQELVQLYNEAILVVFVPLMEPFGLVPLEAMACGTPVIGIREGGVREIIKHEETGLLVDRNTEELAAAIQRLMDDEPLRERLTRNALDDIKNRWTYEKAVDRLEKHFDDAIKKFHAKKVEENA